MSIEIFEDTKIDKINNNGVEIKTDRTIEDQVATDEKRLNDKGNLVEQTLDVGPEQRVIDNTIDIINNSSEKLDLTKLQEAIIKNQQI